MLVIALLAVRELLPLVINATSAGLGKYSPTLHLPLFSRTKDKSLETLVVLYTVVAMAIPPPGMFMCMFPL